MSREMQIEFIWVPSDLGGHRSVPYPGMRPTFRWQRYLSEHLEHARDVECTSLMFDQKTSRGSARLRLISDDPVPADWTCEGNLIELLDGYRVIAVGRIVARSSDGS
jgi:hypothetical protein